MGKKKAVGGRKSVKIKKAVQQKAKPIYNSDDDIPDEGADNYHKDDIDIYNEQLESSDDDLGGIPVAKKAQKEAVYDFSDSEDEEEMEKRLRKIEANVRRRRKKSESSDDDEEGAESEDEDEEGVRAWGKKRDDFYGADTRSKVDLGVSSEDEDAEGRLEEKEARMLQQKLLSQVDEGDFGLDMFSSTPGETEGDAAAEETKTVSAPSQSVAADVSKMSEKEKTRLLKKEYPEFMNIVSDYKLQLLEYKERLGPLLSLYNRKLIPDSAGIELIKRKARLVLDYCTCAQFYLLLRAEKTSVEGHPVVKRMVQFKQLLNEINTAELRFKPEIDFVLSKLSEGKETELQNKNTAVPELVKKVKKKTKTVKAAPAPIPVKRVTIVEEKPKKKKPAANQPKKSMQSLLDDSESEEDVVSSTALPEEQGVSIEETEGEKEALEFYDMMRKRRRLAGQVEDENAEDGEMGGYGDMTQEGMELEDEGDKRAITQEMQKNRGLTAVRPKSQKNPRVKNKLKYQRKKKIHKTMVPQHLRETNRYSGEAAGIRAGRIRSVALS